jgi:hypothetical protein
MGYQWQSFIERYKSIIIRIQKIRGIQTAKFEFDIDQAVDFIRKENSIIVDTFSFNLNDFFLYF